MSFLDLGIEPAIVYQLKKQGITEPFEVQEAAIPDTMRAKIFAAGRQQDLEKL